jgi:hypothetical protein
VVGFFPTLELDELLYSGVARYANALGERSPTIILDDIFGKHAVAANPNLVTCLNSFIARLPNPATYSANELINQHTTYPYYARFLPEAVGEAARDLLRSEGGGGRLFNLLRPRRGLALPRVLQFCSECAEEDLKRIGVGAWRRAHQLPGVLCCPKHRTILLASRVGIGKTRHRNQFVALDASTLAEGRRLEIPTTADQARLQRLAVASQWLLDNVGEPLGASALRCRHRLALREAGWCAANGVIKTRELLQALESRLGRGFLASLGCEFTEDPSRSWLAAVVRIRRQTGDPLLHLLLLEFLGVSVEEFFRNVPAASQSMPGIRRARPACRSQPTALVFSPCSNPLCSAFSPEYRHVLSATGLSLGTYEVKCDRCDFAYRWSPAHPTNRTIVRTGQRWDKELRRLVIDERLPVRAISRRLGVRPNSVQRNAYRLGIWRDDWSVTRHRRRRPGQVRDQHRARWQQLMKDHPDASTYELNGIDPKAYGYLKNLDPEWLKENAPAKRQSRDPRYSRHRRESELLDAVRHAITKQGKSEGRPEKICPASISRWIGEDGVERKEFLAQMPRLATVLAAECESPTDFSRRKLAWAAQCYAGEGIVPDARELCDRAAIRWQLRSAFADEAAELIRLIEASLNRMAAAHPESDVTKKHTMRNDARKQRRESRCGLPCGRGERRARRRRSMCAMIPPRPRPRAARA